MSSCSMRHLKLHFIFEMIQQLLLFTIYNGTLQFLHYPEKVHGIETR